MFDGYSDPESTPPIQPDFGQEAGSPATFLTNSDFMRELLQVAPGGTHGWVVNFDGAPRPGANWIGMPYVGGGSMAAEIDNWGLLNTYMSVAAFFTSPDGEQGRQKRFFSRLLALVVDDVVVDEIQGQVSWLMETSPGKSQCGIFLDGQDPDCENLALIDVVMRKFFELGLMGSDKSGNNGVRLVRLPMGTNHKARESGPFRHKVAKWNPRHRVSLEDACAAFGLDLDSCRQLVVEKADGTLQMAPGLPQDEKLAHLAANIARGEALHDSINEFAASLVATGVPGGAVVNILRGMMAGSLAPRDDRFKQRYDDIPRSTRTAQEKFAPPLPPMPLAADVGEPNAKVADPILVRFDSLRGLMTSTKWLIKGYLEAGAMSMLFGAPNVGKSFVAIDQACCVVSGTPWHGNDVQQGPVVMVVGEGHAGIYKRINAWEIKNGKNLDGAPLYITKRSVPFMNAEKALELVAAIEEICRDLDKPPVMIVIDTLARNFGDGDENSTQDANAFIETLDTHLRLRYSWGGSLCHVLIVHHSGHTPGRARGSSAFKGAMDQEFGVVVAGANIKYSPTKMKDAEYPASIEFKLVTGIDLGEEIGSAILGAALESTENLVKTVAVNSKKGKVTVEQILALVADGWIPSITAARESLGLSQDGLYAGLNKCISLGFLEQAKKGSNVGYRITQAGMQAMGATGKWALDGMPDQPPETEGEGE